jgi:uncharacterized protein YyaL (SSP411 family)
MNRLGHETSPYLLQHADNPVDWYPWGEEALSKARQEDKPILLSVGYSACHWCHVMAHESFEDPDTAQVMNELFVNIKVDREERPDLDRIYQTANHLITRRPGGWPLTVFLTPDELVPFFSGTYFPREPRYGMPSFQQVLVRVADYYRKNPADLQEQGPALRTALASLEPAAESSTDALSEQPLARFRETLGQEFDPDYGGFGKAPKFPHPATLERMLRHWWRTSADPEPDVQALYMVALTLKLMGDGGIYDHLGGGFCRYSVDRYWSIPHFEKMLYDNGPLLALYAWLSQVSGDEVYRRIANETADWALRDMRAPEGGFYSSLDADSEAEEGRFYVWTPEQVASLLTEQEYAVFAPRFGLDQEANFEGHWHLRVYEPVDELAKEQKLAESTVRRLLDSARAKLHEVRRGRVWPGRDEKLLTSWNALMIRGLAVAARTLQRPELADAAGEALDFIRTTLADDKGLRATYKDGRARFNAYLDDYAFLLDATLELLQSRWQTGHLAFATWLADRLLEKFQDAERGGFYFTSHDHEQLLHRPKPMSDEALPSGNGVAAVALARLGHLLGETRYLDAAEATLRAGWTAISEYPHGHPTLLTALEEYLQPPEIVILRGKHDELDEWLAVARAVYTPNRLVFAVPNDAEHLPGALAARRPATTPIAYICHGTVCGAPVTRLADLATALSRAGRNTQSQASS